MGHAAALKGEPMLETERLLLRRWLVSDAAVQHQLWTERDPRVPAHRRLSADGHPTVGEIAERIRCAEPTASSGLLAAVRKDDGNVIGYCGLIANTHGQDGEPELAYELLRSEWGRGFATEAACAVLSWAASLGYTRVWASIRDWNAASRRVASKLGFVETSRVEPDAAHGDRLFFVKELEPAGNYPNSPGAISVNREK